LRLNSYPKSSISQWGKLPKDPKVLEKSLQNVRDKDMPMGYITSSRLSQEDANAMIPPSLANPPKFYFGVEAVTRTFLGQNGDVKYHVVIFRRTRSVREGVIEREIPTSVLEDLGFDVPPGQTARFNEFDYGNGKFFSVDVYSELTNIDRFTLGSGRVKPGETLTIDGAAISYWRGQHRSINPSAFPGYWQYDISILGDPFIRNVYEKLFLDPETKKFRQEELTAEEKVLFSKMNLKELTAEELAELNEDKILPSVGKEFPGWPPSDVVAP
jgi:hypothetical protein